MPDYKDKEKLTQHSCFPVDKDGVGVCSEPDCYRILWDIINYTWARKNFVDSILYLQPLFPSKSESLNLIKEETSGLDSAIKRILVKGSFDIVIRYRASTNEENNQKQKEKIDVLRKYILDKTGISENLIRIDAHFDDGTANSVEIIAVPWISFD